MKPGDEPAFPYWNQLGTSSKPFPAGPGISVRELFALGAMVAMVGRDDATDHSAEEIVDAAYKVADLMVKRGRK